MTENTSADKLTRLEGEDELIADYPERLLDIAGLDGDIEIDVKNERAGIEIISEHSSDLDRLVGEDGEILDALQELARLTVQTEAGERLRLMLDIAGFCAECKAELQDPIMEAVTRPHATGETQKLEAMNPFERKVCHDVIAEESFLSESKDAGPHRCVVILPAGEDEVERAETEGSEEE